MPTSDAKYTRNELVRASLRMLGVKNPSANEVANGVEALNLRMKEIDVEGRWLHCVSQTPTQLDLVSGTATYSYSTTGPSSEIASDILDIEVAEIWTGASGKPDYELVKLTKSQAERTVWRGESGDPVEFYLQRDDDPASNQLWVFPTPSSALTLKYYYRRRIYDFDASTDNPDMPQQWNRALRYALAADLAPEYGQDQREPLFAARYEEAKRIAIRANSEKSTRTPVMAEYY